MKVKDVLAMIGDGPLLEALKNRGYACFGEGDSATFDMAAEMETRGYVVFGENEEGKAIEYLENLDYHVLEPGEFDIAEGFELYRNKRQDEFRQWLRDLFWQALGRIV